MSLERPAGDLNGILGKTGIRFPRCADLVAQDWHFLSVAVRCMLKIQSTPSGQIRDASNVFGYAPIRMVGLLMPRLRPQVNPLHAEKSAG